MRGWRVWCTLETMGMITRHVIEDARLTLRVWITSPQAQAVGRTAIIFIGAYIGFSLPI